MRQSIRKYSWTPACNNQLENILDNRVRQWIKKYSWTPACDSQLENTSGQPCDSHFPKGVSAFSQSFPLKHWNKTNVIEMIPHYMSCQQSKPCQQCKHHTAQRISDGIFGSRLIVACLKFRSCRPFYNKTMQAIKLSLSMLVNMQQVCSKYWI